ncbi:MAG: RebB family R body protein [Caulobacterales bacterium]|nr:RebB family R body protein [Caulobacterales bacterium]
MSEGEKRAKGQTRAEGRTRAEAGARAERRTQAEGRTQAKGQTQAKGGAAQGLGVDDVLKLTMELCRDPKTSHLVDGVAATLLAVIGSGPAWTTLQSLIAANQASGAMFHNATHNQQMTNVLGMVATANCVQALLGQTPDVPWPYPNASSGADHDEA